MYKVGDKLIRKDRGTCFVIYRAYQIQNKQWYFEITEVEYDILFYYSYDELVKYYYTKAQHKQIIRRMKLERILGNV